MFAVSNRQLSTVPLERLMALFDVGDRKVAIGVSALRNEIYESHRFSLVRKVQQPLNVLNSAPAGARPARGRRKYTDVGAVQSSTSEVGALRLQVKLLYLQLFAVVATVSPFCRSCLI